MSNANSFFIFHSYNIFCNYNMVKVKVRLLKHRHHDDIFQKANITFLSETQCKSCFLASFTALTSTILLFMRIINYTYKSCNCCLWRRYFVKLILTLELELAWGEEIKAVN